MKSHLSFRLALYGFLVWLVPFIAAIPLFQLLGVNRVIFKSVLGVILAATVALAWNRYALRLTKSFVGHGWTASLVWVLISVAADLLAFIVGFQMDPLVYFSEIATGYLMVPFVVVGSAWSLQSRRTDPSQ